MLREAVFLADESQAEALSDALMDAGVLSVGVEDADADSTDEVPLYGEPGMEPQRCAWRRSRLKALYEDGDVVLADALAQACAALSIARPAIDSDAPVPDQDWVRITQAQFPPMHVTPRLWIVPSWDEPPQPEALNLRLDPGVAFGTGSHPTTSLCLNWLDEHLEPGTDVLDYGCGTGILAIAAKLFGAGRTVGTDIDPLAVEAATANAATNGTDVSFHLPDSLPGGRFPVVISNILASALKVLAPSLTSRVSEGGTLVLSGVLASQADDLIAFYRSVDPSIRLAVWRQKEDWVCIAGSRE